LSHAINVEAQKIKGSEMVFQVSRFPSPLHRRLLTGRKIVNFIQEWLGTNVKPPVEVVGSLALQIVFKSPVLKTAKRPKLDRTVTD
jgi:translation initiation factor 2-alpha kinase 4